MSNNFKFSEETLEKIRETLAWEYVSYQNVNKRIKFTERLSFVDFVSENIVENGIWLERNEGVVFQMANFLQQLQSAGVHQDQATHFKRCAECLLKLLKKKNDDPEAREVLQHCFVHLIEKYTSDADDEWDSVLGLLEHEVHGISVQDLNTELKVAKESCHCMETHPDVKIIQLISSLQRVQALPFLFRTSSDYLSMDMLEMAENAMRTWPTSEIEELRTHANQDADFLQSKEQYHGNFLLAVENVLQAMSPDASILMVPPTLSPQPVITVPPHRETILTVPPKLHREMIVPPQPHSRESVRLKPHRNETVPPKLHCEMIVPMEPHSRESVQLKPQRDETVPPNLHHEMIVPPEPHCRETVSPKLNRVVTLPPKSHCVSSVPLKPRRDVTVPLKPRRDVIVPPKPQREVTVSPKPHRVVTVPTKFHYAELLVTVPSNVQGAEHAVANGSDSEVSIPSFASTVENPSEESEREETIREARVRPPEGLDCQQPSKRLPTVLETPSPNFPSCSRTMATFTSPLSEKSFTAIRPSRCSPWKRSMSENSKQNPKRNDAVRKRRKLFTQDDYLDLSISDSSPQPTNSALTSPSTSFAPPVNVVPVHVPQTTRLRNRTDDLTSKLEDSDSSFVPSPSMSDSEEPVPPKRTKHGKKQFWTAEEETILFRGVARFGRGQWKEIAQHFFKRRRTALQLSDKWQHIKKSKSSAEIKSRLRDVKEDETLA